MPFGRVPAKPALLILSQSPHGIASTLPRWPTVTGIAKIYENYDQLLDDPTIEVLDIAVPPNAQLALIKAACARKNCQRNPRPKTARHELRRRPLRPFSACESAGITLAVNQNMRYDQSVRAAKTLLENGTIGEPVFATIENARHPALDCPGRKISAGSLCGSCRSITLTLFRYWFGDPEGIYCSVRTDPRTKFPHTDGILHLHPRIQKTVCVASASTTPGPAPTKEDCPSDIYIRWRIEGLNGLAIGDIGWCKDPFTTPSTIRFASKGQKTIRSSRLVRKLVSRCLYRHDGRNS